MYKATVVIPNYNGIRYIRTCLDALKQQDTSEYSILVVDNGSKDGSMELIRDEYPEIQLISLPENLGFSAAVNRGIKAAKTPYVILLNNDTEVEPSFVRKLIEGIQGERNIFSGSAKLLRYDDRTRIDDAGNLYCALGWAYAIGKNRPDHDYDRPRQIFSACAGAAIYRRSIFEKIGYFDERHFAYLEDIDIGYRARIAGYANVYLPEARVYHMGSATSGSRYNPWKVTLSARNGIYLNYKNMPLPQLILNAPLLVAGILIKQLFFIRKKMGKAYFKGILQGIQLCDPKYKVAFDRRNLHNYGRIQLELWINILRRMT